MPNRTLAGVGVIGSVGLMLLAFWLWQNAGELTYTFDRPEAAAWAARIGAIGLGAAAQLVIAALVLARIYRRDMWTDIYGIGAAVVMLISLTGAIVVAVAG